jgi:hypothetical protein
MPANPTLFFKQPQHAAQTIAFPPPPVAPPLAAAEEVTPSPAPITDAPANLNSTAPDTELSPAEPVDSEQQVALPVAEPAAEATLPELLTEEASVLAPPVTDDATSTQAAPTGEKPLLVDGLPSDYYRNKYASLIDDDTELTVVDNSHNAQPAPNPPIIATATISAAPQPLQPQPALVKAGSSRIAKYNDEKMPYSFLWWLDKTRREHATTNQPYLSYRYVHPSEAGILHLQAEQALMQPSSSPVLDILADKPPLTPANRSEREQAIIERFIQEEPQIKPSVAAKLLDNENKARKSSEDESELVSETLAKIYVKQMLYHKAITAYKKLMLKFPEKRTYFASQIELLEQKIN